MWGRRRELLGPGITKFVNHKLIEVVRSEQEISYGQDHESRGRA